MSTTADIATVMAGWFRERLGAAVREIRIDPGPSTTGFSCETLFGTVLYRDDAEGLVRDFVIRLEGRQPGLFLHSDLSLQWTMIDSLHRYTCVPVPAPVGFEPNPARLGVPFSVVSRVPGRSAPQVPNYNLSGWILDLPVAQRSILWRHALEALALVHKVDWRHGFRSLGQPRDDDNGLTHLLRKTREWYDWARRNRRHPHIESALARLEATIPSGPPCGVLWGDAAPNNMIFRDDLTVSAVLDWEAAGFGPGEVDLAWWLFYDEYLSAGFGIQRLEGLPNKEQSVAIYETAMGRRVANLEFYELLAHTRNAILSMRSVGRQIELGTISPETQAVTDNPISKLLALKLGVEPPEVGEDYARYLRAVIQQKQIKERAVDVAKADSVLRLLSD